MTFKIVSPVPTRHAEMAAALHFEAFAEKIGGILGLDGRGQRFFADIIDPEFGICVLSTDKDKLLGIAGYKTSSGSLIAGELSDLQRHYGLMGGLWRGAILSILERSVEDDRLLMDGIAVVPAGRGKGIGSALLDAVADRARDLGKSQVRLDVIDINPRARVLYERKGFKPVGEQSIGPLKHVFGFHKSTTMVKSV